MATILKKKSQTSKGIIIFTHKELKHFFRLDSLSFLRRLVYLFKKGLLFEDLQLLTNPKYFPTQIQQIKREYILGVHFGGYCEDAPFPLVEDFLMKSPSNLKNLTHNIPVIPLVSRDFISDFFNTAHRPSKPYWDVILVARNHRVKNLDCFLTSVKKLYQEGYHYKVLLVITSARNENKTDNYTELASDYYKLFNEKERKLITLLKIHPEVSSPGLPAETISILMQNSKTLALFSEREGGPKVVSEALMCGCRVIIYDYIEGGARDAVDDSNSIRFKDFKDAHIAIRQAVELGPLDEQAVTKVIERVSAASSLNKLLSFLHEKFFHEKDNHYLINNVINIDQLDKRIPAHLNDESVPWNSKREVGTSDIFTTIQFEEFKKHLSES